MYSGEQYHQQFLSSPRDRAVRGRFQQTLLDLLPTGADLLDFGAGTGIDAKDYAARGHRTYVYEPSGSMRAQLLKHCHEEIERGAVIDLDLPSACQVHAVTANFAVLNHIADQQALFRDLSRVVEPNGFVLASLLNPYYLGDARYDWWRANLVNLLRHGHYAVGSDSPVHRFSPRVMATAAAPYFHLERVTPRGLGLAGELFMFLVLRRL